MDEKVKVTDSELYGCNDCRVWDPENQPSVLAKIQTDPHFYDDKWFAMVKTGQILYGAPLHVELVICDHHAEKLGRNEIANG